MLATLTMAVDAVHAFVSHQAIPTKLAFAVRTPYAITTVVFLDVNPASRTAFRVLSLLQNRFFHFVERTINTTIMFFFAAFATITRSANVAVKRIVTLAYITQCAATAATRFLLSIVVVVVIPSSILIFSLFVVQLRSVNNQSIESTNTAFVQEPNRDRVRNVMRAIVRRTWNFVIAVTHRNSTVCLQTFLAYPVLALVDRVLCHAVAHQTSHLETKTWRKTILHRKQRIKNLFFQRL